MRKSSQSELSWAEVMPQRAASCNASSAALRRCAVLGGGIFSQTSAHGGLTQNACGFAFVVAIDFAAVRIRTLRGDACGFERGAVGDGDVPIHAIENCRVAACDGVNVCARRRFLFRPRVWSQPRPTIHSPGAAVLTRAAMRCFMSREICCPPDRHSAFQNRRSQDAHEHR